MTEKYNALLIDDDIEFCELLAEYLSKEGFNMTMAHDGEAGLQKAISQPFDIIILDVMLPKMNGFDVLKKIKTEITVPVLMLTAKGEEVDQVIGLEIGADDYLPKPCSPRLLVARLKAILRRAPLTPETNTTPLSIGSITLNPNKREVTIAGTFIELTNSEYKILECLMTQQNSVVTKETLSEKALNRKIAAFDRSVDMHISHLRNKILDNDADAPKIKTVRGVGYLIEGK